MADFLGIFVIFLLIVFFIGLLLLGIFRIYRAIWRSFKG